MEEPCGAAQLKRNQSFRGSRRGLWLETLRFWKIKKQSWKFPNENSGSAPRLGTLGGGSLDEAARGGSLVREAGTRAWA